MKPTLHLLGLPHTVTASEFSHCAFTGKVQRFAPMMRSVGYHVVHYGNEGATSGANEHVDILFRLELDNFIGGYNPRGPKFVGDVADVSNPLYQEFNRRLANELTARVEPGDIICLPFGHAHEQAVRALTTPAYWLETGIGYPTTFAPFRIFESQAWYHWHCGRENRTGSDYHWVIPNYYDLSQWTTQETPGKYLLYFGRICDIKGMQIVVEIAKHRPDLTVVICGQGDPAPYLSQPNIEYRPPVHGMARDALLGNALAVLMPTRYVEPFGGVTVEAQLTGTPVLGSSFGSFTETILHDVTGYRCRTLGDWLAAVEQVESWDSHHRQYISVIAREKYDMYKLAHDYDAAIRQLIDLADKGWYTLRSDLGPVQRAVTGSSLVSA